MVLVCELCRCVFLLLILLLYYSVTSLLSAFIEREVVMKDQGRSHVVAILFLIQYQEEIAMLGGH